MKVYYKVSKELLRALLEDSFTLGTLQGFGVDNWNGYSDAFNEELILNPEYSTYDDYLEGSIKEFLENLERA